MDYEVNNILAKRIVGGEEEFLINWHPTWESRSNLNCPDKIQQFEESKEGSESEDEEENKNRKPLVKKEVKLNATLVKIVAQAEAALNDPAGKLQALVQLTAKLTLATANAEDFLESEAYALAAFGLQPDQLEANIGQARTVQQTLAQRGENWKEFLLIRDKVKKQLDRARSTLEAIKCSPKSDLIQSKAKLTQAKNTAEQIEVLHEDLASLLELTKRLSPFNFAEKESRLLSVEIEGVQLGFKEFINMLESEIENKEAFELLLAGLDETSLKMCTEVQSAIASRDRQKLNNLSADSDVLHQQIVQLEEETGHMKNLRKSLIIEDQQMPVLQQRIESIQQKLRAAIVEHFPDQEHRIVQAEGRVRKRKNGSAKRAAKNRLMNNG